MGFAEIVAVVRDLAFIAVLVVWTTVSLLLVRKVWSLIGSVGRTVENTRELVSTLSETVARPPPKEAGLFSRVRGPAAWLISRLRSGRRSKAGGS